MKSIMIAGVAGVGKTTMTGKLSEELCLKETDYADFMLQVLNDNSMTKDDLQTMSWEDRNSVYRQVEIYIENMFLKSSQKGIQLMENHLSIIQNGDIKTFDVNDYRRYNLAGICVLESDPNIIAQRRLSDNTRHRVVEQVELINKQQETNKVEALKVAEHYNIPLLFLDNAQNHMPIDAAKQWVESCIDLQDQRLSL
ncbi:MAG TPA: hypothetical protein DCP90_00485 [Clostridiales bacterium]|nr:MAG: hypothetical protein A2Y22_08350 [Clostridiales bacterium GWD2_32_59]HAN09073.1 hypothetical protein [Clostridiales bacterium]